MINVLVNNSINATYMLSAIKGHHEKSKPNLSSWLDLTHLILISLVILGCLSIFLYRLGFSPSKICLRCLSRKLIAHHQQQQQQQQEQKNPHETIYQQLTQQLERLQKEVDEMKKRDLVMKQSMYRAKRHNYPSMRSITSDIVHNNNGCISE